MFCANCGARLDEGSRFCVKCGAPAAQIVTTAELNPAQQAFLLNTQKRQLKGRRLGRAGLILGIIAIVLSLAFAPFIYRSFSEQKMTMTGEDWLLAILTLFISLIVKIFVALLEGLASSIWFILPCVLLLFTGLVLAIVGLVNSKDKKICVPAIIVNASGLLLQLVILGASAAAVCS